jgi:hypothetical protein
LNFRLRLRPILRDLWYELAAKLNTITLNDAKDEVRWKWSTTKRFTVKFVYQQLTSDGGVRPFRAFGKQKYH